MHIATGSLPGYQVWKNTHQCPHAMVESILSGREARFLRGDHRADLGQEGSHHFKQR